MNSISNYKFILALTFLLIVSLLNASAQNTAIELDKYFSTAFKNQRFNGNVLIAENGEIIYQNSFGFADLSTKKLNSSLSAFHIASITKTFTATAILQLVEKGKLNLEDPVEKHLKDFPYPQVTVKHLLSHTSGLPSHEDLFDSMRNVFPDTVFTNADIIPAYSDQKLPLVYEPLEDYNYNNINYALLGLLIEKISDKSLHKYLKEHILEPAEMRDTFFPEKFAYQYTPQEQQNLSLMNGYRNLYTEDLEKIDTVAYATKYWYNYNFEGFGEMISTAPDLLKYDQALYNNNLLQETTLKEAFNPIVLNDGKINDARFGLCWIIGEDSTLGKLVMHGGGLPGLRSFLLRNITKNQTVIILDNHQNEVEDLAIDAVKIINNIKVTSPGKSLARLYAVQLMREGMDTAKSELETLRKDTLAYSLNEEEFNNLGYDLLGNNKISEAVEVFKINIDLFPESWNVYDSYGEALLLIGKKKDAIKMYKKSIELNPQNQNGRRILEEILNEEPVKSDSGSLEHTSSR